MQSQQTQPRPSGRVLKPSQQQQQTRNASPSRSSGPTTTKSKPAPAPVSVLTRDRLQSNLKYYQFLTRVQQLLIETDVVTPATLQRAQLVLRPVDYEEVTQERSNDGRCGWPACGNEVQEASKAKGRYRLSLRQHKVWEVEGAARYCSEACEEASAEYAVELKEEPLYMRRLGDMMAAMQQGGEQKQQEPQPPSESQQQQAAQELLASLPATATSPSAHEALNNSLPSNADTSGLVIVENSDESVQPAVAFQQQTPQPSSSPAAIVGKPAPAPASRRKAGHVTSAPRNVTADSAPSQTKEQPALSDAEDEEELLNSIAQTAISEKAKLNQKLNRISDGSRDPATARLPSSDDSEVQSADETKQNIAAMRQANPLSPFAQLAGLLTHYVTDETIALLRKGGSTAVTPAGSELVRRRQEALLGWLHGELRAVCEELAVRCTRAVEDSVDAVALTFLLNEAVPALPSRLWQVVITVILLALHRWSGAGATLDMDEQAASKFVASRGFTDVHLAALMDIVLPPTTSSTLQTISTPPTHPAATTPATTVTANGASALNTIGSSLLSVPRYLLSSALSFLDSSDLSAASLVCSQFRLLCHPLRQHSDERTLLAHNNSLTATRMHTMGYREGVQEGRELLMQAGFDAGVAEGWRSGRAEEWGKGVLGAVSMWSELQPSQAAASAAGWSAADVDWLWRQCERVNGAVMRRPKERGGRGAINVAAAAADDEKKAAADDDVAWEERCQRLLAQLGADGRQVFDRLAAAMEEGKSAQQSSEQRAHAEQQEVDARIAAQMGGAASLNDGGAGSLSNHPGDVVRSNEAEEAGADDFM